MVSFGFFSQLFQQFVALLSVFCIVPSTPAPALRPAGSDPPAAVATGSEFAPSVRTPSPLRRVIQTQIDNAVSIGAAAARSADDVTFSVLEVPRLLVRGLDRNGVLGLPGGGADAAGGMVNAFERSSVSLVRVLSDALLAELALVPGAALEVRPEPQLAAAVAPIPELVERQPFLVRVVQTQVDGAFGIGRALGGGVLGVGDALLAAPAVVMEAAQRGGLAGIPGGLATAGGRIVVAATDGVVGVIESVADMARAELALVPGSTIGDTRKFAAVGSRLAEHRVGPVEFAVRVPLAAAVAAADLTVAAARATTTVTGAAVTAITDVARAARDPKSELTVTQAIARAPATIGAGFSDAGKVMQSGVKRATTDFRNTLRGRSGQEATAKTNLVGATGGSGTQIRASSVASPAGTQKGEANGAAGGGAGKDGAKPDPATGNETAAADPGSGTPSEGAPAAAGAE
jgi:hypothetical protein